MKFNQGLLAKTKFYQVVKFVRIIHGRITALISNNGADFRKKMRILNDLNTL